MGAAEIISVLASQDEAVSLVVAGDVAGEIPVAPDHHWVLAPRAGGGWLVGAWERGRFALYDEADDDRGAEKLLRRVLVPKVPNDLREGRRAYEASARIAAERLDEGARPADLPVGTAFDHLGSEGGHRLSLLDTDLDDRAASEADLEQPRTGYWLATPLPPEAVAERVAPAHGRPGGAWAVVLPRAIRHYLDTGVLRRFSVLPAPSPDETPAQAAERSRLVLEDRRKRFAGQPRPTRVSRAKRDDHPHWEQVGWVFHLDAGRPARATGPRGVTHEGRVVGLRAVDDAGPAALVLELDGGRVIAVRRADGRERWDDRERDPSTKVVDLDVPVDAWDLGARPGDDERVPAGPTQRWTVRTTDLESPRTSGPQP